MNRENLTKLIELINESDDFNMGSTNSCMLGLTSQFVNGDDSKLKNHYCVHVDFIDFIGMTITDLYRTNSDGPIMIENLGGFQELVYATSIGTDPARYSYEIAGELPQQQQKDIATAMIQDILDGKSPTWKEYLAR
mgnify:CR=1 FL=1